MKTRTFGNFCLGKTNATAYGMVLAAILLPRHRINPLYIYGASGVGKTHLLRAVQHCNPAVYTTAREICDELIRSILHGESWDDKRFRHADIVLIDDLQYIADKTATQDELARLIISLCDWNQQVILACDRPLKELPVLYERMRIRSGCLREVKIFLPDRRLRKKLIRKKTKARGLTISDETVDHILAAASSSLEIDGLLNELQLRRDMNRNWYR